MELDRQMRVRMEEAGRVIVAIRSTVDARSLLGIASKAIHEMVDTWEEDAPLLAGSGLLLSNPAIYFALVPPALIMSVQDIQDMTETFTRLVAALRRLPSDTTVDVIDIPNVADIRRSSTMRLLDLRVAMNADRPEPGYDWQMTSRAATLAATVAVEWLTGLGPHVNVELHMISGEEFPLAETEIRPVIDAQTSIDASTVISARWDHELRGVRFDPASAHVSLLAGVDSADVPFDWARNLDELAAMFTRLEPVADSAFIHHTTDVSASGWQAHGQRALHTLDWRGNLTRQLERALEQERPVDAQAIHFRPNPPDTLPSGWATTPFGHLHRIDAPNLAEWLAQPPTTATIDHGRNALSRLLK